MSSSMRVTEGEGAVRATLKVVQKSDVLGSDVFGSASGQATEEGYTVLRKADTSRGQVRTRWAVM